MLLLVTLRRADVLARFSLDTAVLLHGFAKCQGIHVVNKAGPRGWEGRGVAGIHKVGIVEEEKDGRQW